MRVYKEHSDRKFEKMVEKFKENSRTEFPWGKTAVTKHWRERARANSSGVK
jgi:hypothetical protein